VDINQQTMSWSRRNEPIFCIGVDPGKKWNEWALLTSGAQSGAAHVLAYGKAASHGADIREVLVGCVQDAKHNGAIGTVEITLSIEDQWVPEIKPEKAANFSAIANMLYGTKDVAASRGRWMAFCEARGWPVAVVHPSTWRAVLGGSRALSKRTQKQRAKDSVDQRARHLFRVINRPQRLTHHLAEAILMAEYQLRQMQLNNLQGARS
jgi:hypothetical protein